jgi:hypothetical protein
VEATAARFEVRLTRSLVAGLGIGQVTGDSLQVGGAGCDVKPQRADQGIGGLADLAEREEGIFPPEAVRFGGLGRDD